MQLCKEDNFTFEEKNLGYRQFEIKFLQANLPKILKSANINQPLNLLHGSLSTTLYFNSDNIVLNKLNLYRKFFNLNFVVSDKKNLFLFDQVFSNKFIVGSNFTENTKFLYGKYKKQFNSFVDFFINHKIFSTHYNILLGYNILTKSIQVISQASFSLRNSLEIGVYANYFDMRLYPGFLINFSNKFVNLKTNINIQTNLLNSVYLNFDFTVSFNVGDLLKISLYKIDDKFSKPIFLEYQEKFDPYHNFNYKNISGLDFQLSKNNFLFDFNTTCAFYDYFLSIHLTASTIFYRPDLYFNANFAWNLKNLIIKFNLSSTLSTANNLNWGINIYFNEIKIRRITLNFGVIQKAYNTRPYITIDDLRFTTDSTISVHFNKNSLFFINSNIGIIIKDILIHPLPQFYYELASGFKILL